MNDQTKTMRQFVSVDEAWYGRLLPRRKDNMVAEVLFGISSLAGGPIGEMGMRWYRFAEHHQPTPRLECFGDAWPVLAQCLDVIVALGECDGERLSPQAFCALLTRLGFQDRTPRVRPGER